MGGIRRKKEKKKGRRRERRKKGEMQELPLQKKDRQKKNRPERRQRSACLGRKAEIGSGQSLSLKGTGYPGDRSGHRIYFYNNSDRI